MQKILFTIIFLFFPILLSNNFTVIELCIAAAIYEAKVVVILFSVSFLTGLWSVVSFFKLLAGGFRLRHIIELAISIAICRAAFSGAKYKIKNLHQRPLKIITSRFSLIPDLQKIINDYMQARIRIILIRREIPKLIRIITTKRFLKGQTVAY